MAISSFNKNIICVLFCVIATSSFAQDIQITKPQMLGDVLYHGSTNPDITIFEPRAKHVRDKAEGSVIFATPSIRLASCYLFEWDDSWVYQFISTKDDASYEVYMVISDHKKFKKEDSGGAIYLLPPKGFHFDEKRGLGVYEMISRNKIVPFTKIRFTSALDAMQNFEVKVFFVSRKQFEVFLRLRGEEQEKFLSTLTKKDPRN